MNLSSFKRRLIIRILFSLSLFAAFSFSGQANARGCPFTISGSNSVADGESYRLKIYSRVGAGTWGTPRILDVGRDESFSADYNTALSCPRNGLIFVVKVDILKEGDHGFYQLVGSTSDYFVGATGNNPSPENAELNPIGDICELAEGECEPFPMHQVQGQFIR